MINQIKIQLNLYSHREKDNIIINNLGLDNTPNPNNLARELLYSLATGQTVQMDNSNSDILKNKVMELEKVIETLKSENIMIKAENNILKSKLNLTLTNNEISATKEIVEIKKEIEPKKQNTKLLGSIKSMEI